MLGCLLPRVPPEHQKEEETDNKAMQEGSLHLRGLQCARPAGEVLLGAEEKQRFPALAADGHVQTNPRPQENCRPTKRLFHPLLLQRCTNPNTRLLRAYRPAARSLCLPNGVAYVATQRSYQHPRHAADGCLFRFFRGFLLRWLQYWAGLRQRR